MSRSTETFTLVVIAAAAISAGVIYYTHDKRLPIQAMNETAPATKAVHTSGPPSQHATEAR